MAEVKIRLYFIYYVPFSIDPSVLNGTRAPDSEIIIVSEMSFLTVTSMYSRNHY